MAKLIHAGTRLFFIAALLVAIVGVAVSMEHHAAADSGQEASDFPRAPDARDDYHIDFTDGTGDVTFTESWVMYPAALNVDAQRKMKRLNRYVSIGQNQNATISLSLHDAPDKVRANESQDAADKRPNGNTGSCHPSTTTDDSACNWYDEGELRNRGSGVDVENVEVDINTDPLSDTSLWGSGNDRPDWVHVCASTANSCSSKTRTLTFTESNYSTDQTIKLFVGEIPDEHDCATQYIPITFQFDDQLFNGAYDLGVYWHHGYGKMVPVMTWLSVKIPPSADWEETQYSRTCPGA